MTKTFGKRKRPTVDTSSLSVTQEASKLNLDRFMRGQKQKKLATNPSPLVTAKYEQQILDLGQKNVHYDTCAECGMVYQSSLQTDRSVHDKFHRENGLKFTAQMGLLVKQNEFQFFRVKNIDKVVEYVNTEMSAVDCVPGYVYVACQKNTVIAAVLASDVEFAFKHSISNGILQKEEKTKASLGIDRIWVNSKFRRKGLATQLLDILTTSVTNKIAFSQPTEEGIKLASKYYGNDFLIY